MTIPLPVHRRRTWKIIPLPCSLPNKQGGSLWRHQTCLKELLTTSWPQLSTSFETDSRWQWVLTQLNSCSSSHASSTLVKMISPLTMMSQSSSVLVHTKTRRASRSVPHVETHSRTRKKWSTVPTADSATARLVHRRLGSIPIHKLTRQAFAPREVQSASSVIANSSSRT